MGRLHDLSRTLSRSSFWMFQTCRYIQYGFPKMVVPQNHRCQSSNGLMTWMVWGYPHFRKYPYIYICIYLVSYIQFPFSQIFATYIYIYIFYVIYLSISHSVIWMLFHCATGSFQELERLDELLLAFEESLTELVDEVR